MGRYTFSILHNSRYQEVFSELPDKPISDVAQTLGVYPMQNQFWHYPLCNVYCLSQPDELHQLLLGLVKDLLHWLLKYLKAGDVKNQHDNLFPFAASCPALQLFTKPFDSMKSSFWQGTEIQGMIRTLVVNCAPIFDSSKDIWKTCVERASDRMVLRSACALCEFSLLISQHNHFDHSLSALDSGLKRFFKK